MTIKLKLTPRRDALLLGHDNTLDVLVRAVGPVAPHSALARRRLNLALAVDRSGSMSGQPLEEAKRCAKEIVRQLTADDFVSVIAYDGLAEVVCPARPASDIASVCSAIDRIASRGNTALHDGWAAGAEQAAINVRRADISRVLLLSDGNANHGLTNTHQIADRCAQMARVGVSTSTYGLGVDFNEALMLAMARSGAGNAYYGRTARDLLTPFQQEFDLLQALYARNVQLELSAAEGVRIEVANDLIRTGRGWRLPDIAYGSEAWAIVRLYVPGQLVAQAEQGRIELLSARLSFSIVGNEAASTDVIRLAVPALSEAAFVAVAEDELAARRAQEVRFAEFQRDAADAARGDDWEKVDLILAKARREAVGNAWLAASMVSLEGYAIRRSKERFAKEAAYKSSRMFERLADAQETGDFRASEEKSKSSFLRRRDEEGRG